MDVNRGKLMPLSFRPFAIVLQVVVIFVSTELITILHYLASFTDNHSLEPIDIATSTNRLQLGHGPTETNREPI